MKELLQKIIDWLYSLFYPTIRETKTHYYVELWSDDGHCAFWVEKDKKDM